jgi:hypothetical protein
MANVNNPHGLRPLGRTLSGGFPTVESYQKAVGDAQALYIFDAISRAAGYVTGTSTPGTTLYTGVNLLAGIASTLTDHLVMISPDAMYEAQAAEALTIAKMGYNANLLLSAPAVTTPASAGYTGISGHVLNTAIVTNTLDVHIHRLFSASDNAFGAYQRLEISFNKHALVAGSTVGA